MTDPLRNPLDPLRKANNAAGVALFRKLSAACDGFSADAVIIGAINLLIDAIRAAHGSRALAERAFDEYAAKAKAVLLDQHYDQLGRRRNVFPYDQVIDVPHIRLNGKG
jgi:hypothetical protein